MKPFTMALWLCLLWSVTLNASIETKNHQWPPSFDFDWLYELVEEPAKFAHRSSTFQLGIGFRSDIDLKERVAELDQLDTKVLLPAISLTYEKNVGKNIGIGLSVATQIWKVPLFNYQYRYYSGSLRATYHLNTIDKLDTYIGGALTYRQLNLTNKSDHTKNSKVSGSILIGARYYFNENFGCFLEIGNDALTWFKVGAVFYLP